MKRIKTAARYSLGALFVVAGINHFVFTSAYVGVMPPYLPWPEALVLISGVAEAGLGALLWRQRWSVWAGWGLMALCVAVFPANVHMALHPDLTPGVPPLALWLRLPLQGVLIAWAWWYTRAE